MASGNDSAICWDVFIKMNETTTTTTTVEVRDGSHNPMGLGGTS